MGSSLNTPSDKIGLPPGTIVHVGNVYQNNTNISLLNYTTDHVEEYSIESIKDILGYQKKSGVTWVDIEGLSKCRYCWRKSLKGNVTGAAE